MALQARLKHFIGASSVASRWLTTSISASTSLREPLPGSPKLFTARPSQEAAVVTRTSTLANGVRVVSEDLQGPWCSICLIVDAGTRYETGKFSGAANFTERLAFKSTLLRSQQAISKDLEMFGGDFICSSNRETLMYQGSVFPNYIPAAVKMLTEVALYPAFHPHEIQERHVIACMEEKELPNKASFFLSELVHQAAYGQNTLGQMTACGEKSSAVMTQEILREFHSQHFIAPRIVLGGAGVKHEVLESLAEKYLGILPSVPNLPTAQSVYLGGDCFHPMAESPSNNALQIPLTHICLGFESVSWRDSDLYVVAVLQILLGGGLSFSVGGPGKGMYSRLYQQVMNVHGFAESAIATNISYNDGGIFLLEGSSPPENIGELVLALLSELISVSKFITDEELSRARHQLRSNLLMNLESKAIIAEDAGRQVMAFGERYSAEKLSHSIEKVQKEDIYRVVKRMLKSKPSIAGFGDLKHVPTVDTLTRFIQRSRVNK